MSRVALEGRHTTFKRHSSDILSTLNTTRDNSVDSQDFLRYFFSKTQRDMRRSNIDCRLICRASRKCRESVERMSLECRVSTSKVDTDTQLGPIRIPYSCHKEH
ncbi:hypothetical protein DPMN_085930 [Dreissena polymorpha]|uniref:Uncharacterized protein n=1 Tax=Dreissena polymorpha TaxID=45954 RepID=A0A9D4BJU8_DREPO|nr:hypothetical protein DPMN_085930 [Dreissena polymorpha]